MEEEKKDSPHVRYWKGDKEVTTRKWPERERERKREID